MSLDIFDGAVAPETKSKKRKSAPSQAEEVEEEPGVVYVGRIPHGFYEHQMRSYFSQFGEITKLRLSRNKKTGASKHYAFIEFSSKEVAEIVAETMDNYLLFGHILKCKMIPSEQVHEDLWKGANKRFKVIPWNKITGKKLKEASKSEEWDERVKIENERREKKMLRLKELGYDFEAPQLKTIEQFAQEVERGNSPLAIEDEKVDDEAIEELQTQPAEEEEEKKVEKVEKGKAVKKDAKSAKKAKVEEKGSKRKKTYQSNV